MKRWLYAHQKVELSEDEVEQLLPRLRELLQSATGSEVSPPGGDGSFLVAVPGPALGKELGKQVRVTLGPSRRSGHRQMLPLAWRAAPAGALFPVFDGNLEVEALDTRRCQLTLVGTATPPLGPVGKALDSTVFHAIAERTATRLLHALCLEIAATRGVATVIATPESAGKLALQVADVMTGNPLVIDEQTSVRTASLLLHHGGISGLPVVDLDGVLVGVLSESDLLCHVAPRRSSLARRGRDQNRSREARTAGDACSRPARCTAPDTSLADAAREMLDRDVGRLVVLDAGRIVGILSRHDVLAALIRSDESLRAAVQSVLTDQRALDVVIDLEDGRVRLHGEVERRSLAEQLPAAVAAVEGIDQVEATEVRWRVDDILASLDPPLLILP